MQSQLHQIGDLPQSAALWQNWPEDDVLVYAFYLLLADLQHEDVFAEFIARDEKSNAGDEIARSQPAETA